MIEQQRDRHRPGRRGEGREARVLESAQSSGEGDPWTRARATSGRVGEGEVDGRQAETGGGAGEEVAAGRRVLVIEDDAHIKDLLTDVLTGDGLP